MAQIAVEFTDTTMRIQSHAFSCEFPEVEKNKKAVLVFLRSLCHPETGKSLFTYQELADAFGYTARQNVENFLAEFRASEQSFVQFLTRVNTKHDRLFPLVEAQVLSSVFLSVHQHYLAFCAAHPQETLSEATFREYVKDLDGGKILQKVRQMASKTELSLDVQRYLQELLELKEVSAVKRKEIVEVFPTVETSSSEARNAPDVDLRQSAVSRKLLVVLLYVYNVPQEVLALLFGVGKTSIHTWIYAICGEEVEWRILREIVCWSGHVSFDEKWVKIKGQWYFVLCAVDSVSGFPLLIDLYPTLDTVSWTLFFKRFDALYGRPKLIQSDGSRALAAAREIVFPGVQYQLCKFHKLKNLMKRLRQHIDDQKLLKRCTRLAKHIFSNSWVSSRKQAAKTLQNLAGQEVSAYLETHIFSVWRHLTQSLTNNAAERFNRKIEKCLSGRYGFSSTTSVEVLLRGLWLKELVLNGRKHLDATSQITKLDLAEICQESLNVDKILHSFDDYALSRTEKLA
jgi:transposase-like protein